MSSIEFEKSVECPVCLDVFKQPKSLPCGHCLCAECVGGVTRGGGLLILCPVCRVESDVPAAGFPTNYTIAAVIEQIKTNSTAKEVKYKCITCAGNFAPTELYVCADCDHSVYCSHCVIAQHNSHQLTKLTAAMEKHNVEKAAFVAGCVEYLVGSRENVQECRLNVERQLQRLYDRINEHFAQKADQLVRNGESLMALLTAPGKPTSLGAFPPFTLNVNDLQRQIDEHNAHVMQYIGLDVLRHVAETADVLARHLPEALVQPPVAPVQPAVAPVQPAVAPVQPPVAPVQPAVAPVQPAVAPVQPAVAPVQPAVVAVIGLLLRQQGPPLRPTSTPAGRR